MKISPQQAEALGGCQECRPAEAPRITGRATPLPSVVVADPSKPDWIGIELLGPDGAPVPAEPFLVELADGRQITGKLDNLGRVRIEGVTPGECTVTFPERDAREWRPR